MFEWKPEYSVQIPGIDAQHKQLFGAAADLHTAMSQGQGNAILARSLARLVDYTKAHFAAEERLMHQYQYPGVEAHKVQHDQLTVQVIEFQRKFLGGETVLTVELMMFLKNWLAGHILGSDQQYAAHIRMRTAA